LLRCFNFRKFVKVTKKENVNPKIRVPSIKQIISGEISIEMARCIHEINYGKRKVKKHN